MYVGPPFYTTMCNLTLLCLDSCMLSSSMSQLLPEAKKPDTQVYALSKLLQESHAQCAEVYITLTGKVLISPSPPLTIHA